MYLPPHKRFSLAIHTERAWMVKDAERSTPGRKSRSVTWRGDIAHKAALFECLEWAWARWTEDGNPGCPWDLAN